MGQPTRKHKPILPDDGEGIQIKTDDDDPRFNNALARGLAIRRAFQLDQKLLGNVELAETTALPKSTISRLTFTLTQLGYLRYREEFGKYELAAGVVGLAYPYLANMALPAIARPLIQRRPHADGAEFARLSANADAGRDGAQRAPPACHGGRNQEAAGHRADHTFTGPALSRTDRKTHVTTRH